jgi:hypothetical protein
MPAGPRRAGYKSIPPNKKLRRPSTLISCSEAATLTRWPRRRTGYRGDEIRDSEYRVGPKFAGTGFRWDVSWLCGELGLQDTPLRYVSLSHQPPLRLLVECLGMGRSRRLAPRAIVQWNGSGWGDPDGSRLGLLWLCFEPRKVPLGAVSGKSYSPRPATDRTASDSWPIHVSMEGSLVNVNFNFFAWIREGVRQSVLLGVSDAIETIGAPDNSNELHPQLQDLLRNDSGESGSNRAIEGSGGGGGNRKRLGRRLKDLEKPEPAAS